MCLRERVRVRERERKERVYLFERKRELIIKKGRRKEERQRKTVRLKTNDFWKIVEL